jgi:superfamily II DNA or RNA helicase
MKIKGFEVDQHLWDALRQGQKSSITTALSFLRKPEATKSCLLSMPTGAGKTGVITVVSHISSQRRVLVVSHRRAVREQLFDQIKERFFDKVAPGRELRRKAVNSFDGTPLERGIYVTTFQKLASLMPDVLEAVKKSVDLLIVDEGHSEPSPVWSQVARELDAKKIVVTATPYRNDLFAFDIDPGSSHVYTFDEAVKQGDLVSPQFEQINRDHLVARVQELFERFPKAKCIVKCRTFKDIEAYYELFSGHFKTLAIHEQFTGTKSEAKRASVPSDLAKSDWKIIVHQHKLDEGVDIPQARVLILTYTVGSGRELVQAIGRVVRKYDGLPSFIIECQGAANRAMWSNYLDFDAYLATPAKRTAFLQSLDTAALLRKYLEAFPDISYFESSFRKKFELKTIEVETSLKIPLASVCFIRKANEFSLAVMTDRLLWDSTRDGELVDARYDVQGMNVILSICFKNSRFLDEHLFFEPSLEVTILKDFDDFIAVFDSRGRDFSEETDYKLSTAIDVNALLTLAAREETTRTKETHVSAISTNARRPERTSMSGSNLEYVGYNQGNSAYAITTVKVDNVDAVGERKSSYYLGVGSGRVSDQMRRNFSLAELDIWMQDVAEVIQKPPASRSALLRSYAKPIKSRPTTAPVSAVLDLSDFPHPIRLSHDDKEVKIENNFIYSKYDDGFIFIHDARELKFELQFNEKGHAALSCEADVRYDLEGYIIPGCDQQGSFTDLISEHVPLKLLYADGTSYFDGHFYQVMLPVEEGFELSQSKLGGAIIEIPELIGEGLSEKEEGGVSGDAFGPHSIFFQIDKLKAVGIPGSTVRDHGPFFTHIANLDLMLCADMGTEPADFILSSPDKLVFVHVKCGGAQHRPESSAGALAEVGGQAIKNLEILTTMRRDLKPGNWPIMPNHWPKPAAVPALYERIRLVDGKRFLNDGQVEEVRKSKLHNIWNTIADRRASPAVSKEIWMIVGNAFSRSHFETQLRRGRAAASESLQAFQLIDSWQSTAANNDVALKIFVSP